MMAGNTSTTDQDHRDSVEDSDKIRHDDNDKRKQVKEVEESKGISTECGDNEETKKDDNESIISTSIVHKVSSQAKDDIDTDRKENEASNGSHRDMDSALIETTTLRIDNFRRPFTLPAVKAIVQEVGSFVDQGFWMNSIKTHCFVTYESIEIAKQTMKALQGRVWPPETGQALSVQFASHTAMEVPLSAQNEIAPTHPLKRKVNENGAVVRTRDIARRSNVALLQTKTKPVIYYLPWTDEQVAARKAKRQARQTTTRRGPGRGFTTRRP